MSPVGILNYGLGNLRSVFNAFEALSASPVLLDAPRELSTVERVVLPGVGAFGDAMRGLAAGGWTEALRREVLEKGKPFLGLCLGMQLLAGSSTEHGLHPGLGFLPGTVTRLPQPDPALRLPHIGWNDVRPAPGSRLYAGLPESSAFYFVHSYHFTPDDPLAVSGRCEYGVSFAASVEQGHLFATQFHPEKSQRAGLTVLKNFLAVRG